MFEKMKKIFISIMLAVLALSGCTRSIPSSLTQSDSQGGLFAKSASTPIPPGDYVHTVDIAGETIETARTRSYYLHVPNSYDNTTAVGLLILFPADGETARDFLKETGFLSFTDKEGLIVVVPDAYSEGMKWNNGVTKTSGPDDVLFMKALLQKMKDNFKIDATKVFLSGKGTGGIMAYQTAASLGDQIAAVGVYGASVGYRAESGATPKTIPSPVTPVSVIAIHGMDDEQIPYGNTKKAKNAAAGYLTFDESEYFWKTAIGCAENLQSRQTKHDHLLWHTWTSCGNGTELKTISIWTGTSTWPDGTAKIKGISVDIGATQVIWEFLINHPKSVS